QAPRRRHLARRRGAGDRQRPQRPHDPADPARAGRGPDPGRPRQPGGEPGAPGGGVVTAVHDPLWVTFLKGLVLSVVLLGAFAYMTLIERKLLGRFQHRYGPNRVGPFGLLQPIADAIKTIFKEDIVVTAADKFVFVLAPGLSIF